LSSFFTWVIDASIVVGIIGFIVGLLVTIYMAFKRNSEYKKWMIITILGLGLFVLGSFNK